MYFGDKQTDTNVYVKSTQSNVFFHTD